MLPRPGYIAARRPRWARLDATPRTGCGQEEVPSRRWTSSSLAGLCCTCGRTRSGGVQASFDFRGAKKTAAGRMLTVIFTNDLTAALTPEKLPADVLAGAAGRTPGRARLTIPPSLTGLHPYGVAANEALGIAALRTPLPSEQDRSAGAGGMPECRTLFTALSPGFSETPWISRCGL